MNREKKQPYKKNARLPKARALAFRVLGKLNTEVRVCVKIAGSFSPHNQNSRTRTPGSALLSSLRGGFRELRDGKGNKTATQTAGAINLIQLQHNTEISRPVP